MRGVVGSEGVVEYWLKMWGVGVGWGVEYWLKMWGVGVGWGVGCGG